MVMYFLFSPGSVSLPRILPPVSIWTLPKRLWAIFCLTICQFFKINQDSAAGDYGLQQPSRIYQLRSLENMAPQTSAKEMMPPFRVVLLADAAAAAAAAEAAVPERFLASLVSRLSGVVLVGGADLDYLTDTEGKYCPIFSQRPLMLRLDHPPHPLRPPSNKTVQVSPLITHGDVIVSNADHIVNNVQVESPLGLNWSQMISYSQTCGNISTLMYCLDHTMVMIGNAAYIYGGRRNSITDHILIWPPRLTPQGPLETGFFRHYPHCDPSQRNQCGPCLAVSQHGCATIPPSGTTYRFGGWSDDGLLLWAPATGWVHVFTPGPAPQKQDIQDQMTVLGDTLVVTGEMGGVDDWLSVGGSEVSEYQHIR
ncbi:hypothetical protein BDK51DRAFT_27862 [Blyttiomyces helicus]|uniref:Uncharacterized protein n=1 Tax=Blyttiomyces helicus TaxID=388810 RepID=A0A4P9WLM6_9FUNG|nr:hypothetical protein BDK51DRAFT_27862 [Blyttiomyces helicus]|eukprot:RKO93939.1 hypothetical protein BDK51DRAFT_27862 [Blyttiomyces helicus]